MTKGSGSGSDLQVIFALLQAGPSGWAAALAASSCRLSGAEAASIWRRDAAGEWQELARTAEPTAAAPRQILLHHGDNPPWRLDLWLPAGALLAPALEKKLLALLACLALMDQRLTPSLQCPEEIRQMEQARRDWEQVFDAQRDGVCLVENHLLLRANRAFSELLHLPLASLTGRPYDEVVAGLPEYHEISQESEHAEGSHTREFRFGQPWRMVVETTFTLPDDGTSTREVMVLRDVTERRLLQQQLVQAEKLAALGELVSGVAHELNNPLATVVGYAKLMESDTTLPEAARRRAGLIHQESLRAASIVEGLQAMARSNLPQSAPVDLNELLSTLVKMRMYSVDPGEITVESDYAPDLPPLQADAAGLQEAFLHLLNNAVQATLQWRGSGVIRLATSAVENPPGVRVTLSDNGPGIAPEYMRRVFDPFFTTREGQGTGLGTSIALGIISRHGGRLWVESELGEGACFIAELPAAATDVTPTSPPAKKQVAGSGHGGRVLVVDDEEPVVLLITEILTTEGLEVTAAYSGEEALELLETQRFDLIISDLRMPAVGGPSFVERLQTTHQHFLPRVVFVTGDTVTRSLQSFLLHTGRPVVTKPFAPDRLRQVVRDQLPPTT